MSKRAVFTALAATLCLVVSGFVSAEINQGSHLNTGGQSKVNKALAKGYLQSGDDGAKRMESRSQVNIGSKRAGTCTMNVAAQPAGKGSKEVIVTAKEIINICK